MHETMDDEPVASRTKSMDLTPIVYEVLDDGQAAGGMDTIPRTSTQDDSHESWDADHMTVTTEEFLLQSFWMNWENELRWVHQHQVLAQ